MNEEKTPKIQPTEQIQNGELVDLTKMSAAEYIGILSKIIRANAEFEAGRAKTLLMNGHVKDDSAMFRDAALHAARSEAYEVIGCMISRDLYSGSDRYGNIDGFYIRTY